MADPERHHLLLDFIRESNRIEGINREPLQREVDAHLAFLALDRVTVDDLCVFVKAVAKVALRERVGQDVRVGARTPPPGGPAVRSRLHAILNATDRNAYETHVAYETLHPFMDGNGRSGRVLWLWMMLRDRSDPYVLMRGFLHSWYYQSLQHAR